MNYNAFMGILRALVPAIVAYAVGRGWITASSAGEIGAAVITLGSAGWSVATNMPQGSMPGATKYQSGGGVILLALALSSLGWFGEARAADLKAPAAKASPFSFSGYPVNSGFYFGANTEVAAGSANGVETGAINQNTGKLFSAEGDLGLNIGYVFARQGQPIWYAVEATFDWANINAQTNGLAITGPLNFEQIAILGAPWDQVTQFQPTINFGAFPGLPQLPAGTTAGPGALYIFGGLREQNVSAQFNVGQNRAWLVGLTTGIGTRWLLSNHSALDARIEYLAPTNSVCFVNGVGQGCAGLGQGIGTRLSVLF